MSENEITMADSTSCAVHCANEQQGGSVTAEQVPDSACQKAVSRVKRKSKRRGMLSIEEVEQQFDATIEDNAERRKAFADCMGMSLKQAIEESKCRKVAHAQRQPLAAEEHELVSGAVNPETGKAVSGRDDVPELPDNDGLEPIVAGNCIIGGCSEINGSDAVACTEYIPTRHELLQLARYWYDTLLGIHLDWFFLAQSGSYESRMLVYAGRRLDRIAKVIGQEATDKVVAEVEAEHQERMGTDWEVFIRGNDEEWEVVRARVNEEVRRSIGQKEAT